MSIHDSKKTMPSITTIGMFEGTLEASLGTQAPTRRGQLPRANPFRSTGRGLSASIFAISAMLFLSLAACGPAPSNDTDGDGHNANTDCDNLDPNTYPGAEEVCNDGVDQDCSGSDLRDCDGDGYNVDEDCNDADAQIYPGMPEKEYDGIDQDCSGSDLNDQDLDGFIGARAGGDDCDDLDDSIFPGATDIPYDAIDQDCVAGDLIDVDEDGFASVDAGGDDCNDDDSSIHPNSPEVAYDGIDQDCVAGDERDIDNDGVEAAAVGGADCNDADGLSFPGAEEVPYDSVDQDCDGIDLTDVDVDGISFPVDCNDSDAAVSPQAPEVSCNAVDENCDSLTSDQDCDGAESLLLGGDDCNDLQYDIHPRALELRNDVDDNCDGRVDESQDFEQPGSAFVTENKIQTGAAVLTADLDGDGLEELIFGAPGYSDQEAAGRGVIYIVPGQVEPLESRDLGTDLGNVRVLRGAAAGDAFGSAIAAVDLDGDQLPELMVGAPDANGPAGRAGALYIFQGARQSWLQNPQADEASYILHGAHEGDHFAQVVSAVGDVDGQGAPDFLVSAPDATANNLVQAGCSWLFLGEELGLLESLNSAAFKMSGTWPAGRLGAMLSSAGDLNNDGFQDIAISTPGADNGSGRIAVFFGRTDVRTWNPDQPGLLLKADGPLDEAGGLGPMLSPGDINGDQIDDLILAAPRAGDEAAGRVFFLFGKSESWSNSLDLSTRSNGVLQGERAGDGLGSLLTAGLVDDDDLTDFYIGTAPGTSSLLYLFNGRATTSFEGLSPAVAMAAWHADDETSLTGGLLATDLDQDGRADLIVSARVEKHDQSGEEMETEALLLFNWQ